MRVFKNHESCEFLKSFSCDFLASMRVWFLKSMRVWSSVHASMVILKAYASINCEIPCEYEISGHASFGEKLLASLGDKFHASMKFLFHASMYQISCEFHTKSVPCEFQFEIPASL